MNWLIRNKTYSEVKEMIKNSYEFINQEFKTINQDMVDNILTKFNEIGDIYIYS